ncbi:MAG: DNA polymerase I [Clostridia bacterium]|nr:DNA polymerase I [Clostridia bacterium]
MEKLLIIDGNSIINRAFYAIRALANKQGMFTNGIYGFLNILFKHTEELEPDYIAVAFDLKAPTFRHKKYDKYKAQRKGMPEELRMQMPVMKEILKAMNIAIFEKEGYEADDIIGTVSRECEEQGVECYILTGDKDDLQLAGKTTKILLTVTRMGNTTTTVYDEDYVLETMGVTPTEFIDVKGLMGDTSDNVPGVAGIGEKTAFSYIQKFKSIENLYEHLDDPIVKPAARKKLEDGRDMAMLSKELCTIDRHVPMDFDIESTRVKEYNNELLTTIFKNLEFNAFLKKLGSKSSGTKAEPLACTVLDDCSALADKLSGVSDKLVYRIYQTNGAFYAFAFICGKEIYYICSDLLNTDYEIVQIIKPLMENSNIQKISSDIKSDMVLLASYDGKIRNYFDTGVAAYIINPARSTYGISEIAGEFLDIIIPSEDEVLGTGKGKKSFDMLSQAELTRFIGNELSAIELLKDYEQKTIKEHEQENLLCSIELPLVEVLADMEIEGVLVDKQMLSSFNTMLTQRIATLEQEIYSHAEEEFNINSTKQLGVVLFEKLGLKAIKKTKTGYSTNSDVLEKLSGKHPIVDNVIEYRHLAKLKSTYADGLLAVINDKTGRIHSKFNQTVTVTGRISSTEPNLQNIPVRTELGREIRKMFVAKDNCVLVDADYSQIELRILAHMAQDKKMIDAFCSNADIHTSTAANVFGVEESEVTPLLRTRAKAVNFGIVYGMGDFSLSQDLHITKKEAKEYIDNYFAKYSNVRAYLDNTVAQAKEKGYVTTLFGRRRYVPELASTNHMVKAFGERVAMNTPIQGTAADIIKIAMVSVYNELKKQSLPAKLILQVHDELIIEAEEQCAEQVKQLLEECMESAISLSVPLVADTHSGKSWYDAK